MRIPARIRERVARRAGDRREYCRIEQAAVPFLRFHVEHVVAKQHRGPDDESNLALACHHCNLHKGTNLTAIDLETGGLAVLFNPRTQRWDEHFAVRRGVVTGSTPTGRATVALLAMNRRERVLLRREE